MRKTAFGVFVLAFAVLSGSPTPADPPKDSDDPNQLGVEIEALKTLNALELTPSQLRRLADLAKGTADQHERDAATASAKYRSAQLALHTALATNDEDKIDRAQAKLDELADEAELAVDDEVQKTAAAKERSVQVLKLLKGKQVAAWIPLISVVDPADALADAYEEAREADEPEKFREEKAADVAEYFPEKREAVRSKTLELLKRAQEMSGADFEAKSAELTEAARKLIGDIDPMTVLRHNVEGAAAELLSNPGLEKAIAIARHRKPEVL